MPTRAAEHHRGQHWAASPIEEHLGEDAMRVSYPGTKILMGDHSLNDFVMPASVTSRILEGDRITLWHTRKHRALNT